MVSSILNPVLILAIVCAGCAYTTEAQASGASARNVDDNNVDENTLSISDSIRKELLNGQLSTNDSYDSEQLPEELGTYTAPEYLQKNFPFYLSGYDYEDRPIWVAEFGKYDIRSALEGQGNVSAAELEKWMTKMLYEGRKSRIEKGVEDLVYILDFEGFNIRQFSHAPTVIYLIRYSRRLSELAQKRLGQTIIINANYITRVLVDLMRPVFGRVYDHLEVFGTNKERWVPELRRRFPPESIPTWYGGNKNFKPIKTFG